MVVVILRLLCPDVLVAVLAVLVVLVARVARGRGWRRRARVVGRADRPIRLWAPA
ncbi:hypothetical protein AB0K43_08605 [Kitasatospora sp. NPDC049258]|uniref:hypothetical protein n=1 Tax=Kitasatospora sp. NPDC049258 TaxID=3155394 RepID=UPI0034266581